MKFSLGELSEKLQYLESYCDGLKKALRDATEVVSHENNVARSSGKKNSEMPKNGKPKLLNPEQDPQANFSSFASLRNLSWNKVLKKGTQYYSEEFSRFGDEKMSLIITTLNWTRPWSEQMLQAFFVAAKGVWLLHFLAFSFNPALGILRVEVNRVFESSYMGSSSSSGPTRVKVMVMPGFYV